MGCGCGSCGKDGPSGLSYLHPYLDGGCGCSSTGDSTLMDGGCGCSSTGDSTLMDDSQHCSRRRPTYSIGASHSPLEPPSSMLPGHSAERATSATALDIPAGWNRPREEHTLLRGWLRRRNPSLISRVRNQVASASFSSVGSTHSASQAHAAAPSGLLPHAIWDRSGAAPRPVPRPGPLPPRGRLPQMEETTEPPPPPEDDRPEECDEPFDPPEPRVRSRGESECDRRADTIDQNMAECEAPDVDCACPRGPGCQRCMEEQFNSLLRMPTPVLDVRVANDTVASLEDFVLLVAAWNLIEDNIDVVEWIACLVRGPNVAECMVEKFTDPDREQVLEFDQDPPLGQGNSNGWTGLLSGRIHLALDRGKSWPRSRRRMRRGLETGNFDQAFCGLVWAASLLVHEMMHACLGPHREGGRSHGPGKCDTTFMVGSSFQWAMAQRFPCIKNNGLCLFLGDDDLWMSDF